MKNIKDKVSQNELKLFGSRIERKIFYNIKKVFPKTENRIKKFGKEIDIWIDEINVGIEYNNGQYHQEEKDIKKDKEKYNHFKTNDIDVWIIRGQKMKIISDTEFIHFKGKDGTKNLLNDIFEHIKKEKILTKEQLIKIENVQNSEEVKNDTYPEKAFIYPFLQDSLLNKFPEIAKEWDYEKNGDLTPDKISSCSGQYVWWKSPCGCPYQAPVSTKTKDHKDPFSTGKNVCIHYCLAVNCPEIANKWHPTKNEKLTSFDVAKSSHEKVWWQCIKCKYEWNATVNDIITNSKRRKSDCPNCSGRSRWTKKEDDDLRLWYEIEGLVISEIVPKYIEKYKKNRSTSAISHRMDRDLKCRHTKEQTISAKSRVASNQYN